MKNGKEDLVYYAVSKYNKANVKSIYQYGISIEVEK